MTNPHPRALLTLSLAAALLFSAACGLPTPPSATVSPAPSLAAPTISPVAATEPPPAASATPPALPVDLSGEWVAVEAFPTDPARAGYVRFTFAGEGAEVTGRYALPLSDRTGALDAIVVDGAQVTWTLADRGRTIAFAGAAAGGMLTATATLNGASVPVTLLRLADGVSAQAVLGWYRVEAEHLIALFLDGGQLYYRDFLTGRMSLLLPVAPDTYVGGPAWQLPVPVETRVTFTRSGEAVTGLVWEQAGQPAFSAARVPDFYRTTDGQFANGDVTLAGTLFTPVRPGVAADALYPAVVMLHGSEPGRRRDPFRWLAAEWLAYYGVAALIYDKRGVGGSTGQYLENASDSNLGNLAQDGLAGLAWLRAQPNIDPQQVGALGASQAGWVGPRMAAAAPELAFLVMVVGPTVSPGQEEVYESLLANHPRDGQAQTDPAITRQVLSVGPTPFDPLPYLQAISVPALWIYGGLDASIPAYASAEIIEQLRAAGQTNLEVQFYPEGNHSLFSARTGFSEEMPYLPGFIPGWNAAEMAWILDHVRVPSADPAIGQPISIETADGLALPGTQYGAGRTAVIFATTSDTRQDTWAEVAQEVAQAGYLALTFDFRFWEPGNARALDLMNAADTDLLAAVEYARGQGAEQVVVIGASLGGLAAAKIAAQTGLDGLVVLGAPLSDPALTIHVTPEELAAATMPKLIVLSTNDTAVAAARTQALYDLAADPKELLTFPSTQHATQLLAGPHAADLRAAILTFLNTHTPAP